MAKPYPMPPLPRSESRINHERTDTALNTLTCRGGRLYPLPISFGPSEYVEKKASKTRVPSAPLYHLLISLFKELESRFQTQSQKFEFNNINFIVLMFTVICNLWKVTLLFH